MRRGGYESDIINTEYCLRELNKVIREDNGKTIPDIFHYTSTEVLESLLSGATFWASNLYYLNDSSEYKTGIECLRNIINDDCVKNNKKYQFLHECLCEISELDGYLWPGIFSISFCTKADLLNQWIAYSKEGGVCIELDKDILFHSASLKLIEEQEDTIIYMSNECISKMLYDSSKMTIDKIRKAIDETLRGYVCGKKITIAIYKRYKPVVKLWLTLLASFFKNQDFYMEAEVRMVFTRLSKDNKHANIYYNKRENGILRPYLKIVFSQMGETAMELKPAIPITSIMVGPAGNQEALFSSVVHRVEYGKSCIWKYDDEKMGRLLTKYINACLKYCSKKTDGSEESKEMLKHIAVALFKEWNDRLDGQYQLSDFDIQYIGDEWELEDDLHIVYLDEVPNYVSSENDMIQEADKSAMNDWRENNYFSIQGIWVKKSSIPYVF